MARNRIFAKRGVFSKTTQDLTGQGGWDMERMFRYFADKEHIAHNNGCCDEDTDNTVFPVRFNSSTGGSEYFNGTAWVEMSSGVGGAAATGITAHAGGGQGSATAVTVGYNEVTTVATAGDSVKLPAATVSSTVVIKNEGATAADIFPATGDTINDGSANTAIRIAPGSTITFVAVDSTNWEASNQIVAAGDGAAALPALTFSTQPNMGLYKVSSTQLGASVSGALVGGFNATGAFTDVISEQTATAGVTVDGLLIKDGGASANSMFAGFFPTAAAQALSGAGAVNITAYLTKYTSTGGAQALTIAAGSQIGQRKKVSHVVDGGSGVLTGTFVGGTNITFTTVGEFADLIWTGTAWGVLELGNTATPGTPPALA